MDAAEAKHSLFAWALPEPQEQQVSVAPTGTAIEWPSRDGLWAAVVQRRELFIGKSRRGSGNENADKVKQ